MMPTFSAYTTTGRVVISAILLLIAPQSNLFSDARLPAAPLRYLGQLSKMKLQSGKRVNAMTVVIRGYTTLST